MSAADPGTLSAMISALALVVSGISLYFTKVNWIQSNRPVVTAFVTEHHSGSKVATFNLIVTNTGSRPAVRVRLRASHSSIRCFVEEGVSEKRFDMIQSNFLRDSEIPLLRNGESLTTSFGAFTPDDPDGPWLRYGAEADITIEYRDLDRRSYASAQPLKIYARDEFGGGTWGDAPI